MDMVVVDTDVVSFLAKGDSREALYSSAMCRDFPAKPELPLPATEESERVAIHSCAG
jgi:hypothetical protein